jgi:hypothetical protein
MIAVWTLPLYQVSETRTIGRSNLTRQYRVTALDTRARGVVVLMSVLPVVATLISLFVKRLRVPVGITLLLFVLVGAMSIGLCYLPAALMLLIPSKARPNSR